MTDAIERTMDDVSQEAENRKKLNALLEQGKKQGKISSKQLIETLDAVDESAYLGMVLAHSDGGVPVMTVDCGALDEAKLGELFYFMELSCVLSAYILGVNPFDQPGVEQYKHNMFALLGKPGYEH